MKMDEMTSNKRSESDSNVDLNENSVEIREKLVETAVKFLKNPKVRRSPLSQKKAFLEGKGLTSSEVEASIAKAGEDENHMKNESIPSGKFQQVMPAAYNTYSAGLSRWSLIRDYCATIVFIGSAACGFYQLVKKYLLPYLSGIPNDEERRLVKLETQMVTFNSILNDTMSHLRDGITELQETLQQVKRKQDVVVASQASTLDSNDLETQFGELHTEIASLKGLLLNRHQFPPTPCIAPIIPTWQMISGDDVASTSATVANCDELTTADEEEDNVAESPHSPEIS